ncbi:hypothetical protein SAMD00019534_015270 [Acytostelium subglobosum LB1]|uniref:hypothetical protein n=1 Tax=Acytostelium subglobosum LB1 TaxID=1410327 RepID=UPI0006449B69|nr:hypothetical protein SAMD00019534_015270 [Acytostelium subglobosum LB1]GAM18352.1 hypothetical protein SAMD00019534_015270 [Acytostelium subglobosum LB1]|eukprot:XP_012757572.1 hypothetical protein SAMD00019534_015270 [Acytostelium subglobosum LB1]
MIINRINNWMTNYQDKAMHHLEQLNVDPALSKIIQPSMDEMNTDIGDIAFEEDDNFYLIGSNYTFEDFQRFITLQVSKYQTFSRSKFAPDLDLIEMNLACQFLSGKIHGVRQMTKFMVDLPLLDDDTESSGVDSISKLNDQPLVSQSIKDLTRISSRLSDGYKQAFTVQLTRDFERECSRLRQEELEYISRIFTSLIGRMIKSNTIALQLLNSSIIESCAMFGIDTSDIPTLMANHLNHATLANIRGVAQIIVDTYLKFGYLYSDIIDEPPGAPNIEVTNHFETLKQSLIREATESKDSTANWIEYVQAIIQLLSSLESKVALRVAQFDTPLLQHIQLHLKGIPASLALANATSLGLIISFATLDTFSNDGYLPISYFPLFMRTMHEILSQLTIISEQGNRDAPPYQELYIYTPPNQTPSKVEAAEPDIVEDAIFDPSMLAPIEQPRSHLLDDAPDPSHVPDIDQSSSQLIRIRPVAYSPIHCLLEWLRHVPEIRHLSIDAAQHLGPLSRTFAQFWGLCFREANQELVVSTLYNELMNFSKAVKSGHNAFIRHFFKSIGHLFTEFGELFDMYAVCKCTCGTSPKRKKKSSFFVISKHDNKPATATLPDRSKKRPICNCPDINIDVKEQPPYLFIFPGEERGVVSSIELGIDKYTLHSVLFEDHDTNNELERYNIIIRDTDGSFNISSSEEMSKPQNHPILLIYSLDQRVSLSSVTTKSTSTSATQDPPSSSSYTVLSDPSSDDISTTLGSSSLQLPIGDTQSSATALSSFSSKPDKWTNDDFLDWVLSPTLVFKDAELLHDVLFENDVNTFKIAYALTALGGTLEKLLLKNGISQDTIIEFNRRLDDQYKRDSKIPDQQTIVKDDLDLRNKFIQIGFHTKSIDGLLASMREMEIPRVSTLKGCLSDPKHDDEVKLSSTYKQFIKYSLEDNHNNNNNNNNNNNKSNN